MPKIGEIKLGQAIGKAKWHSYIWAACEGCGKERWVTLIRGKPSKQLCLKCSRPKGKNHHYWKGGRIVYPAGYIGVLLQPDDFFYPMANSKGYVREHRLVVAKALNRCLLPWELVHHKGVKYPEGSIENKSDNRYPENLELLPIKKYHLPSMLWQAQLKKRDKKIERLEQRITLLEAEIVVLKQEPILAVTTKKIE